MTVRIFISNITREHEIVIFGRSPCGHRINGTWTVGNVFMMDNIKFRRLKSTEEDKEMMLQEGSVKFMIRHGYMTVLPEEVPA